MTYDWAADAFNSYQLARQLQREKLLRERAWKHIGPRDDEERKIAEGE
jgi:hypothetical protein